MTAPHKTWPHKNWPNKNWPNKHWLAKTAITWPLVLGVVVLWSGVVLGLNYHTGLGRFLQAHITSPFAFKMRTALDASPHVDKRLKIFGVDDPTFAALGSWVLAIDEWALALESLDKKAPKAIVIDAMFSKVPDPRNKYGWAHEKIAKLKTPIITGAYVAPQKITYRDDLNLTANHFRMTSLFKEQGADASIAEQSLSFNSEDKFFPMVDRSSWFSYGPAKSLSRLFRTVGHFTYAGDGQVPAFLRVGKGTVMPHMALLLAGQLTSSSRSLYADQRRVPVTADGLIPVNIPRPADLFRQTFSMKQLLLESTKGLAAKGVDKGDVVVIIPHLYTGNTDFKETPQGPLPGGFIIAALANSILTGNWLTPWSEEGVFIVTASILGGVLVWCCGIVGFWLWFVAFSGILLVGSVLAFVEHGLLFPWPMPLMAFGGTALSLFAEKTRRNEQKARFLRNTLTGSVAPEDLQQLIKRPSQVNFDASEQVVTLVFFDVAGFSLTAEKMMPRITFDHLKDLLGRISQHVYEHGGIVDRTLGDGLLCYFGYAFGDVSPKPFHADQALQCAIAVQKQNIELAMAAADQNQPIYPLRIGINTAPCYLGDLGFGEQVDFTVVGNGVNLAKRFEGACDPHSILMGTTTYELLNPDRTSGHQLSKRLIQIKHHDQPLVAHEYDLLAEAPQLRRQAEAAYRAWTELKRRDQRWTLQDSSLLTIHTNVGAARLIDFSHSGLQLGLNKLLTKDSTITVNLGSANVALNQALKELQIGELIGEVRWSYCEDEEFIHGIWLKYPDTQLGARIIELLWHFDGAQASKLDSFASESSEAS